MAGPAGALPAPMSDSELLSEFSLRIALAGDGRAPAPRLRTDGGKATQPETDLRLRGSTLDAVRLGLAWLFYDAYGVWLKHGMLFEGLGLYLTRELIGTRLTWFVQPSQYERSDVTSVPAASTVAEATVASSAPSSG